MKDTEIKNGRISGTMFGREDHGIMTFSIFVDANACHFGVGGYAIDQTNPETKEREFWGRGLEVISKILDVVGVDTWEKLPGRYIRFKDKGWGETVDEIGNIMEDKWVNLRTEFSRK